DPVHGEESFAVARTGHHRLPLVSLHRDLFQAQMRGTGFVCWQSTVVVVVLVPVQWHHVVVLVLLQWHHARIIARAARSLRSENPLLSQIEKLVLDSQVICQSGKPHAFIRVSLANLSTQIPCPAFDILWSVGCRTLGAAG